MVRQRVRYQKVGMIRFSSHKDTMRVFRRGFAASETPVQYSQGFNPHPKLSFGPSLRTGWQGLDEYMDMQLEEPTLDLPQRCNPCLPDGLEILDTAVLDDAVPKLSTDVVAARYEAVIDPVDLDPERNQTWRALLEQADATTADTNGRLQVIEHAVREHFAVGSPQSDRGEQETPRLIEVEVCPTNNDEIQIKYLSEMNNGRSVAPVAVAAVVLGEEADLETPLRVTRTALYVRRDGALVPPISSEVVTQKRPKTS